MYPFYESLYGLLVFFQSAQMYNYLVSYFHKSMIRTSCDVSPGNEK